MNVLLTDARLRTCLYVARSLGKKGLNVFAGESAWLSPHFADPTQVLSFRSKFCKGFFFYPHPADLNPFIPYIAKLAKNFDALIPINEDTIIPICRSSEKFNNILLPRFQDLEVALDKKEISDLCLKLGVPVPQTFFPSNPGDLKKLAKELNYPVIVKWRRETPEYPRYRICYSKEDLFQKYRVMHKMQSNPIIQEQIEGFGTGFFALFDKNHRLKAYFIHRRIREYPLSGGPSTYCASFWNKQVLEYGLKLLKALHWVGIGMVEFKFDNKDHVPKVMEINPRFWGSLPLAILSGVDFPYLLSKLIIGEDFFPVTKYKLNVKCRLTDDFRALLENLQKSNNKYSAMKTIISSIPIKNADFDFKDQSTSIIMMKPILKTIAKIPRKILRI
jgi:predicted ATP-grasp superfamily ATP-dependent carboligase